MHNRLDDLAVDSHRDAERWKLCTKDLNEMSAYMQQRWRYLRTRSCLRRDSVQTIAQTSFSSSFQATAILYTLIGHSIDGESKNHVKI